MLVLVAFQKEGLRTETDEVLLTEGKDVIVYRSPADTEDKNDVCTVKLNDLLPVAVQQANTPMKRKLLNLVEQWDIMLTCKFRTWWISVSRRLTGHKFAPSVRLH